VTAYDTQQLEMKTVSESMDKRKTSLGNGIKETKKVHISGNNTIYKRGLSQTSEGCLLIDGPTAPHLR
jgi:hypothetical protein